MAASKVIWRSDFEIFEGVEGSLARGFLGLSRVGLMCGIHQKIKFLNITKQ